jgi:hypothetical protein
MTRAYKFGYDDAVKYSHNNQYKRCLKRQEYDDGYNDGLKEKMKTHIKNKPQLFHNSVANHNKKRMTIHIQNGSVKDVVRENIDCELFICNYDIDGIDVETNKHCYQDQYGEWYQLTILQ